MPDCYDLVSTYVCGLVFLHIDNDKPENNGNCAKQLERQNPTKTAGNNRLKYRQQYISHYRSNRAFNFLILDLHWAETDLTLYRQWGTRDCCQALGIPYKTQIKN